MPEQGLAHGMDTIAMGGYFAVYAVFLIAGAATPLVKFLPARALTVTACAIGACTSGVQALLVSSLIQPSLPVFAGIMIAARGVQGIVAGIGTSAALVLLAAQFQDLTMHATAAMSAAGIGLLAGPVVGGVAAGLMSAAGAYLLQGALAALLAVAMYLSSPYLPAMSGNDVLGVSVFSDLSRLTTSLAMDQADSPHTTLLPMSVNSVLATGTVVSPSKLLKHTSVSWLLVCVLLCSSSLGFLIPSLAPHLSKYGFQPMDVGLLFGVAVTAYLLTATSLGSCMAGRPRTDGFAAASMGLVAAGLAECAAGFIAMGPAFGWIPLTLPEQLIAFGLVGTGAACAFLPAAAAAAPRVSMSGSGASETLLLLLATAMSFGQIIGPALFGGMLLRHLVFSFCCAVMAACLAVAALAAALTACVQCCSARHSRLAAHQSAELEPAISSNRAVL